jgi:hypothetical protein
MVIQTIERVAGGDAGFASRAAIQSYFKSVLFVLCWFAEGYQLTIGVARNGMLVVSFRKASDWSLQLRLLSEQFINQRLHHG